MTDERDPLVASLFADAEREFDDEAFISDVMQRVQRRSRRVLVTRISIVLALVALEFALESPLQQSLGVAAEVMGDPLIAAGNGWISFLLSPVNSIAGLLGLTLLGLNFLYRRVMH